MGSSKCGRSKQTSAETRTLLISPIHQTNRDWRLAAKVIQETAQHFETCQNSEAAIQPSTVRHRVKMAPKQQCTIGFTSKRRPGVTRSIIVMFHRKPLQFALKPLTRLKPHRTPRNPLSAVIVCCQCSELLKVGDYPEGISRHTAPPDNARLLRLLEMQS